MAKHLTLILFSILTFSCGSRKVNVDKIDSVVKKDSTSVTKKETTTTQENNISIVTNTDELEVCPVSDTIPMVVNGITYKNAKLRYKKTKKVLADNTKTKVSEKALNEVKVKNTAVVKSLKKEIDKKANYSVYLWWLLILFLIALGYFTYKKINKTLF